jgi:tRNA (guanine37-N1)-methyltransferase
MSFKIGVVSLLPEIVAPVERYGVVGRACERGLLEIAHTSPREFATDTHRTVDDRPYGGGPGMVLKYEPLRDAIRSARSELPSDCPAYVLSARGTPFDQSLARDLAAGPGVLLVAGRYEGVDERLVQSEVVAELSVGDYVLSGGELAAAIVIDAVARLLPEVLGHEDSSDEESYMTGLLEYPQYTRPEVVDGLRVPEVLLRGDHAEIRRWRLKQALGDTWRRRPDLLKERELSSEEKKLLDEFVGESDKLRGSQSEG